MSWISDPAQPSRSERLATALGGNAIWCHGFLPSDWTGLDWTGLDLPGGLHGMDRIPGTARLEMEAMMWLEPQMLV
jgi:hypothetical protein